MKVHFLALVMVVFTACNGNNIDSSPAKASDKSAKASIVCDGTIGKNDHYTFKTVSAKKAFLTLGESKLDLKCKAASNEGQGANHPDAAEQIMECVENRGGDGLYIVSVHTQGLSPIVLADISQQQAFGLPAAKLGTLICK